MAAIATADDWILVPGKGSIAPDPAFSRWLDDPSLSIDCGPWTALTAVRNPEAIPTAGKTFVSPDRRFSAQTAVSDNEFYLIIKDARTGSTSRLTSALCPIFTPQWSPDSKTLLAVEHASETSLIGLAHWDGRHWLQFEIDAPEGGDNDKCHVVSWEFKSDYLKTTYTVDHRNERGGSLDFYKCTFCIDPADGKTSDVSKTAITRDEFLLLRNASN